jgi:hypothetical protein
MLVMNPILALAASSAPATTPELPTFDFDHAAGGSLPQTKAVQLSNGERFTITLRNTCKDKFKLVVSGVGLVATARAVPCVAASDTVVSEPITHDKRYGAYEVRIEPVAGEPMPLKVGDAVLYPKSDILTVTTRSWDTIFSAGFTVSKLTTPKYALEATTPTGSYVVRRPRDAEDSAALGLAAFVTVRRSEPAAWWEPGYTFGLGTGDKTRLQYYLGLSLMLGQLVVTAGSNIGTVDHLPKGLQEGNVVTDANALQTPGMRTATGAFLALSYTFYADSARTSLGAGFKPADSK